MGLWGRILEDVPWADIEETFSFGPEIGSGSLGVVRLCYERSSGEVFACKSIQKCILREDENREDVRREVQIMRLLSREAHPQVVQLKTVFEDSASLHLVMEYCRGGELFAVLAERGSFTEPEAADIFRQIVKGVQFCHSQGILHRDLKPENVLVTEYISGELEDLSSHGAFLRNFSTGSASSSGTSIADSEGSHREARSVLSEPNSWERLDSDNWQGGGLRGEGSMGWEVRGEVAGAAELEEVGDLSTLNVENWERESGGETDEDISNASKSCRDEIKIRVKLGDFGLAVFMDLDGKYRSLSSKASELQCPTPLYSAPELALARAYGREADMWSLGVILYALIGGELPFRGSTQKELDRCIRRRRLKFSSGPWLSVSDSVKSLIRRLLDTNPQRRPLTAEVLIHPWLQQGQHWHSRSDRKLLERSKSLGAKVLPRRTNLERLFAWTPGSSSTPNSCAGTPNPTTARAQGNNAPLFSLFLKTSGKETRAISSGEFSASPVIVPVVSSNSTSPSHTPSPQSPLSPLSAHFSAREAHPLLLDPRCNLSEYEECKKCPGGGPNFGTTSVLVSSGKCPCAVRTEIAPICGMVVEEGVRELKSTWTVEAATLLFCEPSLTSCERETESGGVFLGKKTLKTLKTFKSFKSLKPDQVVMQGWVQQARLLKERLRSYSLRSLPTVEGG